MERELTIAICHKIWKDVNRLIGLHLPKTVEEGYENFGLFEIANFFGMGDYDASKYDLFLKICGAEDGFAGYSLPEKGTSWAVILQRINRAIEAGIIKWPEEV